MNYKEHDIRLPLKPDKRNGFVYFIQCGGEYGPVKIGFSTNVKQRLWDLQLANPLELKLLFYMDAMKVTEKDLHKALENSNIRGEWFRPTRGLELFMLEMFIEQTDREINRLKEKEEEYKKSPQYKYDKIMKGYLGNTQ